MRLSKTLGLGLAVVAMLAFAQAAQAGAIYYFSNITNNGNSDLSGQLWVEVSAVGTTQVSFTFHNDVGIASSITDVYFDDGTLLGIATIASTAGVSFSQGANPPDLPGGESIVPEFDVTATFLADSTNPPPANGVNGATDSLTITFNLINGKTYADTLAALALAGGETSLGADDGLRIGIHVQALGATGGSDSYVNRVPDGGTTLSLLGLALTGLGMVSRRRKA